MLLIKNSLWVVVWVVFVFAIGPLRAETAPQYPRVLKEAIDAIDLCLHWGGETAYDEERGKDIAEGTNRDCPEAKKKAIEAFKLFPNDNRLAEPLLLLNDQGYFDLSKEEKNRLCKNAVPDFKKEFEKMKFDDPFVRAQCPAQAKEIYGK